MKKYIIIIIVSVSMFIAISNRRGQTTAQRIHNDIVDRPLHSDFYGWWIRHEYLNTIRNNITPYFAFEKAKSVSVVFFSDKNKNVTLVYNFHEAEERNIKIINDFEIKILDLFSKNVEYLVQLQKDSVDKTLILTDQNGIKYNFKRYPLKYSSKRPPYCLLHHVFFSGQYYRSGSNDSIHFTVDGKVNGLDKYAAYRIACDFIGPPQFDYVHFYGKNAAINDIFYWEISNDTLNLFHIVEQDRMFKKGSLFLKLIRSDE